jgi:tRNA threonylcarbamoyl adenosine modification protein YeaZ
MNILVVDTTSETFSAALQAGEKVYSIHKIFARPHDETLLPQLDKLLAKAGLDVHALDAVAAANGPGRFTGIRVGMAYAAVAARCLDKPALALTRFSALAFGRPEKRFAAVIPGFRGEKYFQIFKNGKPEGAPQWVKELPPFDVPVIEGEPTAAQLLGPAARALAGKKLPKFEPLYLKPAGYESAKSKAKRP